MKLWRMAILLLPLIVAVVAPSLPAMAVSENVSRSYTSSDTSIVPGSLVSLQRDGEESVVGATAENADALVGIAVNPQRSLMAINVSPGSVQVAVSGTADALVSTIGGSVRRGDQVSISPLIGIGMKAEPGLRVIGIAQKDFDGTASDALSQTVKDKAGKNKDIRVGMIPISIAISYAPDDTKLSEGVLVPAQQVAAVLVGHPVSTTRVIISLVIAVVALTGLIVLVYGSIRGSLISIGRNPLAKLSIYRTLAQVMMMAILLVVVAVVVIYFILR